MNVLILIVASGPDKGRVFELSGNGPILLGRDCEPIPLTDPKASHPHARLTRGDQTWYIEDLRSRFGTFRNHQPISGRVALHDGDYVQVGQTVFVLAQKQVEAPDTTTANDKATKDTPPRTAPRRRASALVTVAAMLAIAALIGANAYQILSFDRVRDDLADARTASESTNSQLLAGINELDTDKDDAALAQVLDILESQKDNTKLLEDIRLAIKAQPEANRPVLEAILAGVEQQSGENETLASVEQKLDTLLEEPRVSGGAVAQNTNLEPVLNDILEALKGLQAADKQLAEIYEVIQVWPVQTQARLAEILSAVRTQPNESKAALERVLAELRSKQITDTDELRLAIRNELRSGLTQTRFALLPTNQAPAEASPAAPTDQPAVQAASKRAETRPGPAAQEYNDSPDDSKLTEMQRLYKQAWLTGQPVTLGGGKINPITGKVADGRTLDPATARAAGITRWEDWYMMDDFAERMRLQRQAMQALSEADLDDDIIRLPEDKRSETNPQQDAPTN